MLKQDKIIITLLILFPVHLDAVYLASLNSPYPLHSFIVYLGNITVKLYS